VNKIPAKQGLIAVHLIRQIIVTKQRLFAALFMVVFLAVQANAAYAHPPIRSAGSLVAGLTHPVLGPDHLLAMLSVGILSAQIGGRAIWTVPATFVAVMGFGGLLGLLGASFTYTELGIALSLITLGIAIAAEQKLSVRIALFFVALFAVFHGFAHGAEMPETARPVLYAVGFLTGTALIHIAGVVIGDIAGHYRAGNIILRIGGGLIAVAGVFFLSGII
jgi:urease accessory protein